MRTHLELEPKDSHRVCDGRAERTYPWTEARRRKLSPTPQPIRRASKATYTPSNDLKTRCVRGPDKRLCNRIHILLYSVRGHTKW
jgi:hypothetical protein